MSYRGLDFGHREDPNKVKPEQVGKGCTVALGLGAILVLILFLLAPPLIHPFMISLWSHWIGWAIFGVAVAGVLVTLITRSPLGVLVAVIFGIVWIVGSFFGGAWRHEAFLEHNQISQIEAEPETSGFRFLPLEVAQTTASNKTTDPQVSPGDVEPLVEENEAKWIAPMVPNNTSTRWFGKQPGDLIINTTSDTERETTEFAPGYELCCFDGDSIGWSSVNKKFWADYSPESYMTRLNDETVIVQPYLTYEFNWSHLLPVMVQQFGGALVIRSDGSIEDVPASEAATRYPGGRFYPHELADYFAHSYQYKDGIWNYMFTHKDMPDVPQLSGTNQFPFLIPTDAGAEWYTAVEPYGSSKSAYMAYYVNATDGTIKVHKFEEPLVGPDRAETFVNNAFNTLKGTSFYEPRPLIKNGNFYWMLSASASGTPDVQFTALVDAYSEDVIKLNNKADLERVVNGEDPRRVGLVVSSSGSSSGGDAANGASGDSGSAGKSADSDNNSEDSGISSTDAPSDEELVKMLRDAADRLEKAKMGGGG